MHGTANCPRFRLLASGRVQQADAAGLTDFDPADWATYAKVIGAGAAVVKAVRIPKPFLLAGDHCADGWLVKDDRGLKAISAQTFARQYQMVPVLPQIEAA